jgi:hypothetical protein
MRVSSLDRRTEQTLWRTAKARKIGVTTPIGCIHDRHTWERLCGIVTNDPYVPADIRAHVSLYRKRCRDASRTTKPATVAELYEM